MPFWGSWKNHYPVDSTIQLSYNRPQVLTNHYLVTLAYGNNKCDNICIMHINLKNPQYHRKPQSILELSTWRKEP